MNRSKYCVFLAKEKNKTVPFYVGVQPHTDGKIELSSFVNKLTAKNRILAVELEKHSQLTIEVIAQSLSNFEARNLRKQYEKSIKGKSNTKLQTSRYATIQIKTDIKEHIVNYCDTNNYKIGAFIADLFMGHVSGSNKI